MSIGVSGVLKSPTIIVLLLISPFILVSMILYMENPKDSTRKLLELINEHSKVAGYKINTQKSHAFLCTNNEKLEEKLRKQSHSPLQQKG